MLEVSLRPVGNSLPIGRLGSPNILLTASNSVLASPLATSESRLGKCYNNVQAMIARAGGEAAYGWALTDLGPHRASGGNTPPPLYRRWLNHVIWRDPQGQLWEVTPNAVIDDPTQQEFRPTEFVLEASATFEIITETEWYTRPTRYLPTRPEGVTVTDCLTKAQHAKEDGERQHWLIEALKSIDSAGFRAREWKVEMIGKRMGSIWLIAD